MRNELTEATGSEMKAHVIMNNLNPGFFEEFGLSWSTYQKYGIDFVLDNIVELSAYMWQNNGVAGAGMNSKSWFVKTTEKDFPF
jgi:hypothetical protein